MKTWILKHGILLLMVFSALETTFAQRTEEVSAHDPVLILEGDTYYVFTTGRGIQVMASKDLETWERLPPVFAEPPQWAVDSVPGFNGHIWAPDITYYKGKYLLFYSISTFGKNRSSIGVASNPTLDPESSAFKWTDHGQVIQSIPGKTHWNAIDPNFILDKSGTPYLSFGSFWGGIKLLQLKPNGIEAVEGQSALQTLASQVNLSKESAEIPQKPMVNPIEAPFIFRHSNGEYYLFVSIDYCCRGAESTYKMIVGRSPQLTGPYLDRQGRKMTEGGGTLLLEGDERWHGVGHNAVVQVGSSTKLIFHGYDARDGGKSKLRIEDLHWDEEGWPWLAR